MINREDVDNLLARIRELELLVSEVRDKEITPASFWGNSFELTQQISRAIHRIEQNRVHELEVVLENQHSCIKEISERLNAEEQKVEKLTLEKKAENTEVSGFTEEIKPIPEVKPEPVEIPKEELKVVTPKKEEKSALSIKEILEKKTLSDFRKSFSLNDRFFFKKELFNGDEAKMSKVISDLNEIHSLHEAIDYVQTELNWDSENSVVADFMTRLEKRFH